MVSIGMTKSGFSVSMAPPRLRLAGPVQQFFQLLCRDGVRDAAWVGQGRFLGAFYKYAVQDADDFSGIGVVDRAAAVAGIGRAVELEHPVGRCLSPPQRARVELVGAGRRNN